MHLLVLGPIQVVGDGRVAPLTAKQRTLLAALAVRAGQSVGAERLIDDLWAEEPPATAAKTLQTYVSQLRAVLGPGDQPGEPRIVTDGAGYRLEVDPAHLDASRFGQLVDEADRSTAREPQRAADLLAEALRMWRGPAYADVAYEPFAEAEIGRLDELRAGAIERRAEVQLALGRHEGMVPELREAVAALPWREQLWASLLLALYRCGRQAEAVLVYRDARDRLVAELGVEPGPELAALAARIRDHDPALAWRPAGVAGEPATPPPVGEPKRRTDERRWATVVAAEAPGFASHLEGLDPEDAGGIERAFVEALDGQVRRFGGTTTRAADGRIVAVFGAPVAHEDDAERAIRAGFGIRRSAPALPGGSGRFQLRVGVATGEVLVSPSGGPDGPLGISGGAAIVAGRLLAAAPIGGIVVDEPTRDGTARAVRYRPAGPDAAWLAEEELAGPTERPMSASPMVGREAEMRLLGALWERVVGERRPHLVTIVGPPGIGKSRLAREFSARVEAEGGQVLGGRSLPYGDTAYGALAQLLRHAVGIRDSEPSQDVRWKLADWLERNFPTEELSRDSRHQMALVGMLDDIVQDRDRLATTMRRVLETLSRQRPTVLVFEDLHWAEADLVGLVEHVAGQVRQAPVLFLVLARPELLAAHPTWGGGLGAYSAVALDSLPDRAAEALVRTLLGDGETPSAVRRIERAAGGNPLFIEEVAGWLAQGGALGQALPSSVRALIAARLDALPEADRALMLDAAVVGASFWRGAVACLGHPGETLDGRLDALELAGFVRREAASTLRGDDEYAFRHDLIPEVAYAMLPRSARAERHRAVATFLEGRPDAPVSVLAHHWREAGDRERAVEYFTQAGEEANRGWTRQRAVALYDQALELLPEDDARRRAITFRRAIAFQAWGHTILEARQLRQPGDAAAD